MLKRVLMKTILIVIFVLITVACSDSLDNSVAKNSSGEKNNDTSDGLSGEIIVGGWPSGDVAFEAIIDEFNELYPDINITLQFQAGDDHHDKLLTSLAAGSGAPDVAMIESAYIGKYRDKTGFVNLLDYGADDMKADFVDYKWDMATSLDGKQVIGIPWDIGPISLFYRRDIFKEVGLSDDPDEVYELLSTPEGYLDVARKVSISGERWMLNDAANFFSGRWKNRDFYDENLNFRFDTDESRELLEISQILRNEGLDAKVTGAEEDALLADGKLVTHISGSWFGGFLKNHIAPDTSGKWGIVRPPYEDAANWGGSFLVIPEQSNNKEAAWEFIKFSLATKDAQNKMFETVDYFPSYIPAWDDQIYSETDEFFGGQNTRQLWVEIAEDIGSSFVTIMDQQTEAILDQSTSTGLDQGLTIDEILENAKEEILTATKQDRDEMEQLIDDAK